MSNFKQQSQGTESSVTSLKRSCVFSNDGRSEELKPMVSHLTKESLWTELPLSAPLVWSGRVQGFGGPFLLIPLLCAIIS